MKNTLSFWAVLFIAAVVLSGCDTKTATRYEYIRLDVANCSFTAVNSVPCEVGVSATGEWEVEPSASWIKVTDKTQTSVIVSVEDNDTDAERIGTLIFTMGEVSEEISINQLSEVGLENIYRYPTQFDLGAVMSPNGRYVGGRIPILNDDESWTHQVVIIDVDHDEWNIVAEVPGSLFGLEKPYCISDTGVFFLMNNMGGTVAYDLEGNYFSPEIPSGWLANSENIQATSSDGTIWAGWAMDNTLNDGGLNRPMKWVNGVPEELPMPEKNFRDSVFVAGIMARGISEDGSVIYGTSWDNNDFGMCYWKDGKFNWVGYDKHTVKTIDAVDGMGNPIKYNIATGMTCTAELTNMSPNGRWIAGTWREEHDINSSTSYPGFFDTENGKTYLFPDIPGGGSTCTDDGLGFTTNGLGGNGGSVIDIESGTVLGSVSQWIEDTYGITPGPGFVVQLSPDKSRLLSLCLAADVATGFRTTHWYIAPAPENR